MKLATDIRDEYLDVKPKEGVEIIPPHENPKLTIRKPSEIMAMVFNDSDRIIGDRIVAKGQPTTVLGPGGIGKSRLVLQMACDVITEKRFLGMDTYAPGLRWLFLQAENSNKRLQFDLQAQMRRAGSQWHEIEERLKIHTLETEEDSFLNLDSIENQGRIAEAIDEHRPDVIVFDTLNCFAVGDLNKDQDMRESCQLTSRIGKRGNPERALIILHHSLTGKAGASKATGYDRASFGRNSKVLQAWTRGQINVSPGSPDSNDTLVVSCGKCSNGKEFAPFAAKLNPVTMIYELDTTFDLSAWESEVAGKKTEGLALSIDTILGLCREPKKKAKLARDVMDESGCTKQYVYRRIKEAVSTKKLHHDKLNDTYLAK